MVLKEKNLRDEIETRHQMNIAEVVQHKDREKEIRFELEYVKEQLKKEQEKVHQFHEQVQWTIANKPDIRLNKKWS